MKPRVLVADDHEEVRQAVARLLTAECEVVGTAADGRELVHAALSLQPDVIVSDVSMPYMSGIEAMEDLERRGYKIPFVLVSTAGSGIDDYIDRGAAAFVSKMNIGHQLIATVFEAAHGQACASPSADGKLFQCSEVRVNATRCVPAR